MVVRLPEPDRDDFTPRSYQQELVDKAKERNLIVPLGTGSGKTFIAVMLIRELADDVRIAYDAGGKRSFFVVDKVALAEQQAEQIRMHTDLTVGLYHGRMNVDMWNKDMWNDFLTQHQVLVMTAQVLVDMLNHGMVHLSRANVLILDECHHALGCSHPYAQIMAKYSALQSHERPRVLGLTASVINNKTRPAQLESVMQALEAVLHSTIDTASDLSSVARHAAKPKIVVLPCADFDVHSNPIVSQVRKRLCDALDFCRDCDFHPDLDLDPTRPVLDCLSRVLCILDQLGAWCASKVCVTWVKQLDKLRKMAITPQQVMFLDLGLSQLRVTMHQLRTLTQPANTSVSALRALLPAKAQKLCDVLQRFRPERREALGGGANESLSCIVFVEQRYVAFVVKLLLTHMAKLDKSLDYLKVDFMIGYSSYNIYDSEQQALHKRQETVLRKFRKNELNVLIATSVLEEGVDVKRCNLVIRFDPPKEYRAYVQSKGRARKENAMYIVLIEQTALQLFKADLKDYQEIEKILLSRCHSRDSQEEQAAQDDDADLDMLLPPYRPVTQHLQYQPQVSMKTAIALVNRYCSKLPSDMFTRLVPECETTMMVMGDGSVAYTATLLLPINSPVKQQVQGVPMRSRRLARMAVALKTCQVLHERKELNEHLLPQGKESVIGLLAMLGDETVDWNIGCRARPGSSRRKQIYDKKTSNALSAALPVASQPCYLHLINMKLTEAATDVANPKNRTCVDPAQCERVFALLSSKPLPKVPEFPVYCRQGQTAVQMHTAPVLLQVTAEQLEHLIAFHRYMFGEVLKLEKAAEYMSFDPATAVFSPLIVACKRVQDLCVMDLPFMQRCVQMADVLPRVPPDNVRRHFQFREECFDDAIVMPWYRNVEQPNCYYVAQILHELNPASPFPDNSFSCFNEYFDKKYKITIYNQTQAMLDVDYTSTRLNLLTPRTVTRRGLPIKSLQERAGQTTAVGMQKQILTPELVDVHVIPASVWNMIVLLPSVLYRLNALLLADELRAQVQKEVFGQETSQLPAEQNWPPLDYGYSHNVQAILLDRQIKEDSRQKARKAEQQQQTEQSALIGDDAFQIGVWDPSWVDSVPGHNDCTVHKLQSAMTNGHSTTNSFGGAAEEEDVVGLGLQSAHPYVDDFEGDDEQTDDLVFDVEFSKHMRKYMAQHASTSTNTHIEPLGWEDDSAQLTTGADTGIQFMSVGPQIDSKALLQDIASFGMDGLVSVPAPIPNQAPPPKMPVPVAKLEPSVTMKAATKRAPQLAVAAWELMDDSDHVRQEDSVLDHLQTMARHGQLDSALAHMVLPTNTHTEPQADSQNGTDTALMQVVDSVQGLDVSNVLSTHRPARRPRTQHKKTIANTTPTATPVGVSDTKSVHDQPHKATFTHDSDLTPDNLYGPSPALILQALTLSNANDGLNLERLETVGDSFLKYASTAFLFHEYPDMHEGKLSFLRSKQVSNFKLYRLGHKILPTHMVGSKFEPHDNWLPPGYFCPPPSVNSRLAAAAPITTVKQDEPVNAADEDENMERNMQLLADGNELTDTQVTHPSNLLKERTGWDDADVLDKEVRQVKDGVETVNLGAVQHMPPPADMFNYNLLNQHSISDKSIADCVEALIGVYLLTYGADGATRFMQWMGLRVRCPQNGIKYKTAAPLLQFTSDAPERLQHLYTKHNFAQVEHNIGYTFKDKAYLVQAFTHASYFYNRVTDCYQRLEFLGDAVLDYVITRHLYDDARNYSPGVLTDLRSALVNNTIFASLAINLQLHLHFLSICPGLSGMIEKFVKLCAEREMDAANLNADLYMVSEEDCDDGQEEDIEVPKAMGDIFESIAGAVYLDSGCSLDVTWRVFHALMSHTIQQCCANPPQSPIRELLELEPEKVRFTKSERNMQTGKVRVTVCVAGQPLFHGSGRNYRIAKCTAAKRALRHVKQLRAQQITMQGR